MGVSGSQSLTGLPVLSGTGGPTVPNWWTAGHAKWPLPLSSTVYGVPVLFLPRDASRHHRSWGYRVVCFEQSAETHLSRMWRSPNALSDTVVRETKSLVITKIEDFRTTSLRGRTGRLRRTARNPLCSGRFLPSYRTACQLNLGIGNSAVLS